MIVYAQQHIATYS